jgi:hypothetical protein
MAHLGSSLFVVAIDLGTAYSGYAFRMTPTLYFHLIKLLLVPWVRAIYFLASY